MLSVNMNLYILERYCYSVNLKHFWSRSNIIDPALFRHNYQGELASIFYETYDSQ